MQVDAFSNDQTAQRPRLLFFAPERSNSAILRAYDLYLDVLLRDAQFHITIMAPNGSPLSKRAKDSHLTFHPLSEFARKLLLRTPQLWPILTATRRWRFDVALSHVGYACRGLGAISTRVVGICHDDAIEDYSAADQVAVLTSTVADFAADILEAPPPIEILPPPYICQFNAITPMPEVKAPLRIGTSASFVTGDGLGVFIHMAQLLKQSHPDVEFVIAGAGPTEHDMKELADQIAPFIDFAGPLSVKELAEKIDIYCLPSREAPYSLALCEMMDAGLACVATCTNGAMDILKGGMVAPLVPIDDAFMMAVQLQELLDDRAHIERIKKACFERIREEDFLEDQFAARLHAMLLGEACPSSGW